MEKLHCDGCGVTEKKNQAKNKIKHVKVTIIDDPRFPQGTKIYEADLCPNCQGQLLHSYFDVSAEGTLELPAFIEPQSLKVAG